MTEGNLVCWYPFSCAAVMEETAVAPALTPSPPPNTPLLKTLLTISSSALTKKLELKKESSSESPLQDSEMHEVITIGDNDDEESTFVNVVDDEKVTDKRANDCVTEDLEGAKRRKSDESSVVAMNNQTPLPTLNQSPFPNTIITPLFHFPDLVDIKNQDNQRICSYQACYSVGYDYYLHRGPSKYELKKMDQAWAQGLDICKYAGPYLAQELLPGPSIPRSYFCQIIKKELVHHLRANFHPGFVKIHAQRNTGFSSLNTNTYYDRRYFRRWFTVPMFMGIEGPEFHGSFTYSRDKHGSFFCCAVQPCGTIPEVIFSKSQQYHA